MLLTTQLETPRTSVTDNGYMDRECGEYKAVGTRIHLAHGVEICNADHPIVTSAHLDELGIE